jgi:hypothetical protein
MLGRYKVEEWFPQKALPTIEDVPHFGRSTQGTRQITLEGGGSYSTGTKINIIHIGCFF